MKKYLEFLETKRKTHIQSGFETTIDSSHLFAFQKHIVQKAIKHGKYAIFSGTGTGKTRMQLMCASIVQQYTSKPVLILAPLAVSGQTKQEASIIGVDLTDITIINYEQLDNIDTSIYGCIILDEASILKNHEGAYRNQIIESFKNTPYKFVFTATPSPNDPMEIGNYSEFLDIMPRNEMLAMYFVHDGGETSKWRLKGHSENIFWEWVSNWATMFQNPSDIGFEQPGYDLPKLNLIERQIVTEKRDNGMMFNSVAVSATNFNAELRATKSDRLNIVADIVNSSTETFIIWIKQNEEGETLRKLIPDATEVSGSDSTEYKESKLLGFARGEFRVLITKAKIAGMGLNFQICHNQIFASPDFSFELVFQGIRRSWRFGQQSEVNIYIITTDTMSNVIQSMQRKQFQFDEMQKRMTNAVNKNITHNKMQRSGKSVITDNYSIYNGDCVQLIQSLPEESVGFSIFSPPFAELYTYSDELEDMGNSKDYKEFMFAFNFLVKELYRVLWSGRNVAVHCMDLPIQKGKEGYIGLRDFSGMILRAFEDAGFIYHSRVTIWKNPVTEMQRTKALGLLHKQIKKDSSMSRVGIPDYILVFRKPGEHSHPITNTELSVDLWQKYASPVWMDIDYGKTLNAREGRDEKDEKHIAPLQLQTIERCIHLWSNKGDTVLTPFLGIGSEVYSAVKMGRKGIGFELKPSYFDAAIDNIQSAEQLSKQQTMF